MGVVERTENKEMNTAVSTEKKETNSAVIGLMTLCGWIAAGFSLFASHSYGSFIPVPSTFGIATKLGYTFKWMLLPSASVFFAIMDSARARGRHKAHPLAGKDHLFQIQKNVLMNTIEQYSLFCIPLLALGASVQTAEQLRFIPTLCILFFVARVLFRLGYPDYRGLGFSLNFFITMFTYGANIYLAYMYGFLAGIEDKTPTLTDRFQ